MVDDKVLGKCVYHICLYCILMLIPDGVADISQQYLQCPTAVAYYHNLAQGS